MVKSLPAMQETWVRSLGQEDPLKKEMATHSSVLAWENPMDRGALQATVHGIAKSRTQLSDFTFLICKMGGDNARFPVWLELGMLPVNHPTWYPRHTRRSQKDRAEESISERQKEEKS